MAKNSYCVQPTDRLVPTARDRDVNAGVGDEGPQL